MISADSNARTRSPWAFALAILGASALAYFLHEILSRFSTYRELYKHHAFYVPEEIDKIGGVILCALAVWSFRRVGWKEVARELGLATSPVPAVAFSLAVSFPMLIGFALTRGLTPHMQVPTILFLTVLSPIVEEIELRGLALRTLQRSTGWPFWKIVWPQAAIFGLGHVEQGASFLEMAGLLLLTGSGAVLFAWLVYRWQSLWYAIALHVFMNLWWELFSVARTAIGGWFPFALQTATIFLAIGLTLYWQRNKASGG